jgi:hypothetical protein
VVEVIGAPVYSAVQPWLLGPAWFRRLTVAAGARAVVGLMLAHADGIDHRLLTIVWMAIAATALALWAPVHCFLNSTGGLPKAAGLGLRSGYSGWWWR